MNKSVRLHFGLVLTIGISVGYDVSFFFSVGSMLRVPGLPFGMVCKLL